MNHAQLVAMLFVLYFSHVVAAEGLTGEDCKGKPEDYCQEPRTCNSVSSSSNSTNNGTNGTCEDSSPKCICNTFDTCDSSSDCVEGERCITGSVEGIEFYSVCYACGESPSDYMESIDFKDADSNDCSSAVCVSVESLGHLPMHELVFPVHRRASVLCDSSENCATPGHMVLFEDKPIMMRTYCQFVPQGCTRRVKYVNSPRMKAGIRIPSKSSHMQFLAFAAKHESRVEQILISAVIRLGF